MSDDARAAAAATADRGRTHRVSDQSAGFRYTRRVQFSETDMAGIVHFSAYFRFMEEAEHALWRAAGVSIGAAEINGGWPRVAAAFDYKRPLRFEDEFEVTVTIAALSRRSIRYAFTITSAGALVGTGSITAVCTRRENGELRAIELPADVIHKLQMAIAAPVS
jgi:YbgC/YbaW family acyl-CoA thioester hydrolase